MKRVSISDLKINDVVVIDGDSSPNIITHSYLWSATELNIGLFSTGTMTEGYKILAKDSRVEILSARKSKAAMSSRAEFLVTWPPPYTSIVSGSDPEVFVVDGNGEVIPAWTFLGSKKKPSKGPALSNGNNNIYWDGFQAEFDTSPSGCLAYHCDSVQRGLAGVLQHARAVDKNAKLSNKSAFMVSKEILQSASEEHVQFGCMPSQNAYGLAGVATDGRDTQFRFAGGHIHFGMQIKDDEEAKRVIKSMDAIVGVACVSLFADIDSPARRNFYGLAGEYRRPAHGIEYRTLSNAWLMHPLVMNLVFELARKAASVGFHRMKSWKAKEKDVIKAIQDCDVDLARRILSDNKQYLVAMLSHLGAYEKGISETAADLFFDGAGKFITNPDDIEGNWKLDNPKDWLIHCEGQGMNIKSFSRKKLQ